MQTRLQRRKVTYVSLLSILLLLFLSACGTEPPATNPENQSGGEERLIQHAMGETLVPNNPERIVVLDSGELDTAIALGITPVGAVTALEGGNFMSYLGDKTAGIENVGTIGQPNLEAITNLAPDLIISSKMRHEDIYQQLSDIAPTVFAERTGVTWKENLTLYAEALNRTEQGDALVQAYNERIEEFQTAMGDRLSTTKISIVRALADVTRIYQKGSFIGTVLEDLGLARPDSQQLADETFVEVGYERIADMDGDFIFVMYYGERDSLDQLQDQAQWKELNGVKNGHVHEVEDDLWMLGIGMGAAQQIIDQLFEYVVQS